MTIMNSNSYDLFGCNDLPAGTVVTGRVHMRRAAGRAGTGTAGRRVRWARVDKVFFFKTVPYPSHTHARRGYTGTTGTSRRVWDFFFCCFFPNGLTGRRVRRVQQVRRVRILIWCEPEGKFLKFEFHGSASTVTSDGRRVQRVFFKKKWPALLKPIPVYPSIPGHGYTDMSCTWRVLANHY
jgi:hypothetical protein